MNHKKLLLVVFFLAFFIFQQVQVSAKTSSNLEILPLSRELQIYVPPQKILVYLYHLSGDGSPIEPYIKCGSGHTAYGCVAIDSGQFFPYDINPYEVDIENDYLLDVVTREMLPKKYHQTAVYAQALAARSFSYYWDNEIGYVDNSTNFQVFVPFTFEHWLDGYPNNPLAPCSSNLTSYQLIVCNALSSKYYISPQGSSLPAKTEFSSDILGVTEVGDQPYLQSVQDPISTVCDAVTGIYGNDRGMSQEGASRWARGDQCSMEESGSAPWPVGWADYRQILVHYYTGIDILDGSGAKVAPDDRWNLLWHNNFGAQFGQKPELQSDQPSTLQIRFQNTSVNLWTANSLEIGYRWYQNGQPIPSDPNWHPIGGTHPEIPAGKECPPLSPSPVDPLTVPDIVAPSSEGYYTLHLDLRHKMPNQPDNDGWFSQQSPAWPDATIDVHVNGPTATPTFAPGPTVTPTATPVITAYFYGPLGPYCVGGGCTAPTGYNNVLTPPTRNEQSMQANDPSAGLLGGGRVETKVLVDGGGIGTLRVYYGLSGESCPAGNELQVSKVSGNVHHYNVPSSGYLDVNLSQVDGGGFILYTRCKTTTGYTGSYGIDSVWHSFVPDGQPPSTPQPPTCVKKCLYEECTYTDGSTDREPARAKLASLSQGLMFTIRNFDRITDQAALLYRVRDEILDTSEEGQRYIDLYYAHSEEIAAILDAHSELADQGLDVVDTFTPGLQALLDGQGSTIVITGEQIQQAQAFLDVLIPYAGPELQQAIADEQEWRPLEYLDGATMDQAWAYLKDFTLPPGATEIKIGETYILTYDDYNNGNELIAQHTTLSQEATIHSLSFYVTNAAGKLRLGLYNDVNGNPGTLVAQTAEFTAVVGWNTQSVQAPTLLPAGSYWLAYLSESDDLHFRYGWPGSGQNTGRNYDYPYGELPATFSSSAESGEFQFSFYATLTVEAEPGTIYVGEINVLHDEMSGASDSLVAQITELPQNAVVQSLNFYVSNAVGKLRLGIYDDSTNGPGMLMTQTDEFTPTVGWNTQNVQSPVLLPAGTYWLAFLPENDDLGFKFEWIQGLYTGRVYGYPFGELPSMVSNQPMGVEYRFSFYATLIVDNTISSPTTGILDDFNRADGSIGSNWFGDTSGFSILSNQLIATSNEAMIAWNDTSFDADQEAYVTLSELNTNTNNEHGLILKAQSAGTFDDGAIEVLYDGAGQRVQIWTYTPFQGWEPWGNDIPTTFIDGDVLSARALANGWVEVYRNGLLIGKRNLTDWPYHADGGYIGLAFLNAEGAIADDFGGGTISGGTLLMASASSPVGSSQLATSSEFIVAASQFEAESNIDKTLLQGVPVGAGQKAYVILPNADSSGPNLLEKPRSHTIRNEGDIKVVYDVASQRIQIWRYELQNGWVQHGKDISVKFVDGDRFRVLVRDDGVLEIYRNGKLFAMRDVLSTSKVK